MAIAGGAASAGASILATTAGAGAYTNLILDGVQVLIKQSGTNAGVFSSSGLVLTGTCKTSDPNNGAGAWLLGTIRSGVSLVVSTTVGLQVKIDNTLYTLALLTTNP